MTTHTNSPKDPLNPSLTPQTEPLSSIEATKETRPAKRIKDTERLERSKNHFVATTERTHYNGHKIDLPRCQAFNVRTDNQCGNIASSKLGYDKCRRHGGQVRKRSAAGEAKRLEAITTQDGIYTEVERTKRYKKNQEHKALTKIAVALELTKYSNYYTPKPTLEDLPALITKLEALENS